MTIHGDRAGHENVAVVFSIEENRFWREDGVKEESVGGEVEVSLSLVGNESYAHNHHHSPKD